MAHISSIPMPKTTLEIKVETPAGFRIRMWLMRLAIGAAGLVAPSTVKVDAKFKAASAKDSMVRFEGDTTAGGKIVLCEYPEGFILRHHGEVVWREWSR
jgi:hypothetical protein